MDFFVDFGCALQFIFWKLMKKNAVGTFQRQEVYGNKVKPNANRGWPIKPVNHIRPQLNSLCPNSCSTPPYKMQMGHPHTGDFNAMGDIK